MIKKTITDCAIVLDIDECLVHTMPEDTEYILDQIKANKNYVSLRNRVYEIFLRDINDPRAETRHARYWGIKRPHLDEFLIFCFAYFKKVIIWSAGRKDYVEALVKVIFKDHKKPHAVLSYDDVIRTDNGYHKPLNIINKLYPNMIDYTKTIFLDDREKNFIKFPMNGVIIPRYAPDETKKIDLDDKTKKNFHKWLDALNMPDKYLLLLAQWLELPNILNTANLQKIHKKGIFRHPLNPEHSAPIHSFYNTGLLRDPCIVTNRPIIRTKIK